MKILLGIDIGTSGTKVILVSEDGRVLASKVCDYPLYTPKEGWAEQIPEDWWQASVKGVKAVMEKAQVSKDDICGVSFSGQMHGLVAMDATGKVLRPSILWCDQRTTEECRETVEAAGSVDELLKMTNNNMITGYTGSKLLWMRKHEPELFAQMTVFQCPKDYIRYRLTGKLSTEVSDASGTGLFNVRERKWSWEIIDKLSLPRSIFPPVFESSDVVGAITKEAAELTGLKEGMPVVAGGGDAVIQTTGMGLVRPGLLGVVLGTSGVVAMGLDKYQDNPGGRLQVFCNNAPDLWHAMGVTLAAGGSYRWYRDVFCNDESEKAKATGADVYDLMTEEAAKAPVGSDKLVFLPYMIGERCPHHDPNARGVFFGMTLKHTKAHINRAVMEGITYSLRQVNDLICDMDKDIKTDTIIASGGGAKSALWRQIIADIFGCPVITQSGSGDGGAYAAALVAGVGVGLYKNIHEACKNLKEETRTLPNPENQKVYAKTYELFKALYPALKPVFEKAAEI